MFPVEQKILEVLYDKFITKNSYFVNTMSKLNYSFIYS